MTDGVYSVPSPSLSLNRFLLAFLYVYFVEIGTNKSSHKKWLGEERKPNLSCANATKPSSSLSLYVIVKGIENTIHHTSHLKNKKKKKIETNSSELMSDGVENPLIGRD